MFSNKISSFKDFRDAVNESLSKRVERLLESGELVEQVLINEFSDNEDQLKPNMTRDEMEQLMSHGQETDDTTVGGFSIVNVEDIHSDITDEEFHKLYMDEFGIDPADDEELDQAEYGDFEITGGLEEQDQLDELSKTTMSNYAQKRSAFTPDNDLAYKAQQQKKAGDKEGAKKTMATMVKRTQGVQRAMRKLGEEEQLDELSKGTLASYIKKASSSSHQNSLSNLSARGMEKHMDHQNDYGDHDRGENEYTKSVKRSKMIGKAVDKLTKESANELDELSPNTLGSYIKKASKERGLAARFGEMKDATKRQKGVEKAVDRLTNKAMGEAACATMKDEDAAAFNTAAAKAHKAGQTHFMFGGKKHPVTIKSHHADTIHKATK